MSWKNWIFENPEGEEPKKESAQKPSDGTLKFPSAIGAQTAVATAPSAPATPTMNIPPQTNPACQPHLEKILEMYDKGFEGLNKPGYDFFEFYKAVITAGVDNPAVYPMALTMAQTMDGSVNKDKLVSESDFYVTEINKVHTSYVESGNSKKSQLIGKKDSERSQLSKELDNLRMQLEAITNQINITQENLNNIDNKYADDLLEVDCKLMANDVAKDRILASIEKVKQGLINNVK